MLGRTSFSSCTYIIAGNSWGCDRTTGDCCTGCGQQEEFYGCADVAIMPTDPALTWIITTTTTPATTTTTTAALDNGPLQDAVNTPPKTTTQKSTDTRSGRKCKPVGAYKWVHGMKDWCKTNCRLGNCPSSHCRCKRWL